MSIKLKFTTITGYAYTKQLTALVFHQFTEHDVKQCQFRKLNPLTSGIVILPKPRSVAFHRRGEFSMEFQ